MGSVTFQVGDERGALDLVNNFSKLLNEFDSSQNMYVFKASHSGPPFEYEGGRFLHQEGRFVYETMCVKEYVGYVVSLLFRLVNTRDTNMNNLKLWAEPKDYGSV